MNRVYFGLAICLAMFFSACNPSEDQKSPEAAQPAHPGKQFHTTYCGACHAIPEPSELDQKTWKNHILVRMGAYMGIYTDNQRYYDSVPEQWVEPGYGGERVRAGNVYPKKPMLNRAEWEQLRDYVLSLAPVQTFGPPNLLPIQNSGIPGFEAHILRPDTILQPVVTAVAIDPIKHEIHAAFIQQELLRTTPQGKIVQRSDGFMGPVQILPRKQGVTVVDIGSMGGSDNPKGVMVTANDLRGLKSGIRNTPFDSLQRPVFTQFGDLDNDGDEDVLLCEFGYHFGALAWHEKTANGKYTKHILHDDDGAVCARIHDFNGDSLPDILALFANADERLVLYLNQGNQQFKQNLLFRFSPTYGCTYTELVDWDKDGLMDILLVNGDNGDYPPILKASHGIRLFRNRGNLKFEEQWFIGMNGAYGLRARDFDMDGDLDIAAVSFYPDYQNRQDEAFLYYQNDGSSKFTAFTFPESKLGRWMVLDADDLDGDGDLDIVLGAFNVKSADALDATYDGWMRENVPLIWLENKKIVK